MTTSSLTVVPVDVHDDDLLHRTYEVNQAAVRLGREDSPVFTEEAYVGAMRTPDEGERHLMLAAVEDGEVRGVANLWFPLLDNLDKAWGDVSVHPDHARRGLGGALLDAMAAESRGADRATLVVNARVPSSEVDRHGYRRFAERHGYALVNVEIVRLQQVPVPLDRIDAWAASAAERAGGYEIRTYVDTFPDELAESLCLLIGQLVVDAPTGDVDWEEEAMTPERLRTRQKFTTAMGRSLFETVAVRDGVVCAQTTLSVPHAEPDAYQWGTFVHREHRGHRLGLAVKAANQRALQERMPHIRRVMTQNAETNQWMIAINEQMGFEPYEAVCEFAVRL